MGFSSISSHVIWLLAIVAVTGTFTHAWFDQQEELDEARGLRRAIDAERLHARVWGTFCHNPVTTAVIANATNNGTMELNATHLTLVVDGRPFSGPSVALPSGRATHVWLPDERVWINRTGIAAEPGAVVLVTEHGARFDLTKVSCRVLTTIVIAPTSANLLGGRTQNFEVAGYDQYGDPMGNITYAWTTTTGSVASTGPTTATLTAGYTPGTAFTVRAGAHGVSVVANVTVRLNVHVGDITTYRNGVATNDFARGDTLEARVIVRHHDNGLVPNATVAIEIRRQNGQLEHSGTATTDANGIASLSYLVPSNAARNQDWTVRVTGITGTQMTYTSASNVETQHTVRII